VYLGAEPWGVTEFLGLNASRLVTEAVFFKEGPIIRVAAFESKASLKSYILWRSVFRSVVPSLQTLDLKIDFQRREQLCAILVRPGCGKQGAVMPDFGARAGFEER